MPTTAGQLVAHLTFALNLVGAEAVATETNPYYSLAL